MSQLSSWRWLCRVHFLNGLGKPILLSSAQAEYVEEFLAELARQGIITHDQRFTVHVEALEPEKLRLQPLNWIGGRRSRHYECSCEFYGDAATPLKDHSHKPPVKAEERSVPLQEGVSITLSPGSASSALPSQAPWEDKRGEQT